MQWKERKRQIIDSRQDDTPGTPIWEMFIPLLNKNNSGNMKDLEDFFGRLACTCFKPKNYKKNPSVFKFRTMELLPWRLDRNCQAQEHMGCYNLVSNSRT